MNNGFSRPLSFQDEISAAQTETRALVEPFTLPGREHDAQMS
jgi:hypothetical protein